jgi:hypothetical protein
MTGVDAIQVTVRPQNLGDIRTLPDETPVWILGQIATGGFTNRYYIEKLDRSAGIGVGSPPVAQEGDMVSVTGMTATIGGERLIMGGLTEVVSTGNPVPEPLLLRNVFLGGGELGAWAPGVTGGVDAYNLGLLITTAGRVTAAGADHFYVDDGCLLQNGTENLGVKVVSGDLAEPAVGSYAVVTGISGAEGSPGSIIRVVRPRKQADIIAY